MISLNKIRKFAAICFEIIAISIITIYSSPQFLKRYQLTDGGSFFDQSQDQPIAYYIASENLTYGTALPKIQLSYLQGQSRLVDVLHLKGPTIKVPGIGHVIRNVFYSCISINAP